MKHIICVSLALFFTSCNLTFDGKFSKVQRGLSRLEVKKLIGEPNATRSDIVPDRPYWGPTEGIASVIGNNAPYEEWQYKDSQYDYYIWFSTTEDKPKKEWVVIGKAKYPQGAVFEASQP